MCSCDAKAEFSAAITPVFSITWLFINNLYMLIIITIMLLNISVETVHLFSAFFSPLSRDFKLTECIWNRKFCNIIKAAQISGCLADISAWMKEHHLQLNLAMTELLVLPATPTLQHDFTIQLGSSTITPSTSVRNLGVIFDDQLTFKEHIAKTARSCRFALLNIRKIRPFLTEHAAQLLVQALVISRTGLLQCTSGWTFIKHNQTFTDDSVCSGTTGLQWTQKSPCYTSLCLLALATSCSSHQVQDIDACI